MALQEQINNNVSNRVADAVFSYAEQEAEWKINNPPASRHDLQTIALKLQYYNSIYTAYRKGSNPEEKLSLRYVRHEMAKMKARLNPTTLNRALYSNIANYIRNFFNGYNLLYRRHNQIIKDITTKRIQEHNLQSLTESLKNAGFRQSIEGPLTKMIAQNLPEFHIRYADIYHKDTDFVLHFKKIPQTDLYYLEKFDALSRPSLEALLKNDGSRISHTFSLLDTNGFSAKEAASLVNGRAVCKDEDWYLLTFSDQRAEQTFQKVPFNLEKALKKLPIKELNNPKQYASILDTLKSGNSKDVTMEVNGQFLKCRIEAAPQNKTVYVLDKNGGLLNIDKLLRKQQSTAQKLVEELNKEQVIDLGQQEYKIRR